MFCVDLRIKSDYFLISNFRCVLYVVCFLLGNSSESEIYLPTFRNILFHLHRQVGEEGIYLPIKMEQAVFRNVGIQNSDAGELPRRKHKTAIISLYSINWLVFTTETKCVYCAVRAETLNILKVFKVLIAHRTNVKGRSYFITRLTLRFLNDTISTT
jgi:hypothetical protein